MRDDPPRVVDVASREWGAPVGGFELSIRGIPAEDPAALPVISAVLRNVGSEIQRFTVPGWLYFFRFAVTGSDGMPILVSPFGRELLKPERRTERLQVSFSPGEATETQIPIGSMFRIRPAAGYLVSATCEPEEGLVVHSNEIAI